MTRTKAAPFVGAKKAIVDAVDALRGDLSAINRAIFDRPEGCFEERFAAGRVADYLTAKGFAVTAPYAGLATALRAEITGRRKGPNVCLIAEYDALPGIGHACGHSMIAASTSVAAAALATLFPDLPGRLSVIGTPAEEGGGGKITMIKNGAFADVDAAMMIHPSNKTRVVARMYAITDMAFTFTGKAAHAAAFPDQGINALDAGVAFYSAVSMLRQQMREGSRVHGIFTHGGDAPNIIPEKVTLRFYVRALSMDYFAKLKKQVIAAARGAAQATGCRLSYKEVSRSYDCFDPSRPMGEAFLANMTALGVVDEGFAEADEIGSSDIGNLSQVVPSLHPEYAIGGREHINHSRNFLEAVVSAKGEAMMLAMTKTMALTAYDLLTGPDLMKRVKAAFAAGRK
jgi:amidohydrolase